MDGKEAIIFEIIESARNAAKNLLSDAQAEVESAKKLAAEADTATSGRRRELIARECEQIVSRHLTLARLDARKAVLREKRARLEDAYALAEQKLLKAPDKYRSLLLELCARSIEKGDSVSVGEADKTILDDKWLDSLSKRVGLPLKRVAPHKGRGVILRGESSDKDITLSAVMSEVKTRTESETARILFGETNGGKQ